MNIYELSHKISRTKKHMHKMENFHLRRNPPHTYSLRRRATCRGHYLATCRAIIQRIPDLLVVINSGVANHTIVVSDPTDIISTYITPTVLTLTMITNYVIDNIDIRPANVTVNTLHQTCNT